jgi:hypothetical protein
MNTARSHAGDCDRKSESPDGGLAGGLGLESCADELLSLALDAFSPPDLESPPAFFDVPEDVFSLPASFDWACAFSSRPAAFVWSVAFSSRPS